ncbi:MAG: hypothetical protein ACAH88_03195, partial [Roseimicrobium sp.]
MKITTFNLSRILTAASVGAAFLAAPLSSQAGPLDFLKKKVKDKVEGKDDRHDHDHDHDNDRDRYRGDRDDHRGHDHGDPRYR